MTVIQTPRGDIEYRLEGHGNTVILLLYGGHTNANTRLGEDYFLERGCKILAVSRPGYGKTPLGTGRTPDLFADALVGLLKELDIHQVRVVGISGGGPTAMRFAAKYPGLTDKLILQSSISFAPWPDTITRLGAHVLFNPLVGGLVWRLIHFWLKRNPRAALITMIRNLSTLNPQKVVDGFSTKQIGDLTDLFAGMGSGHGFTNDIETVTGDATDIHVPTLIIHSKYDRQVPLTHPRVLTQQIAGSKLFITEAESHLIWFSRHYTEVQKVMDDFLGFSHPAA